ncbi:hypothetical protein F7D09_1327 [Bifidobacterium leontopitheci]|uniref:Uncharacterized protein n=1 Tax=Bifidobacterium leontopitheci TaxID=2650774 RepID=A0A6I1GER9_9BIFI|nr:hypothetical protein F7D09_1327 [Bifidobacterium leontopitheci]
MTCRGGRALGSALLEGRCRNIREMFRKRPCCMDCVGDRGSFPGGRFRPEDARGRGRGHRGMARSEVVHDFLPASNRERTHVRSHMHKRLIPPFCIMRMCGFVRFAVHDLLGRANRERSPHGFTSQQPDSPTYLPSSAALAATDSREAIMNGTYATAQTVWRVSFGGRGVTPAARTSAEINNGGEAGRRSMFCTVCGSRRCLTKRFCARCGAQW